MKKERTPKISTSLPTEAHRNSGHPPIRHVVFDLGNVLVRLDRETPFRRLLPHLPSDRSALARNDRQGFDALIQEPAEALETGRIDFALFHEWVCDILGISLTINHLRFIWCDMFTLDEHMVALGKRLTSMYDTVLASNTNQVHYDWITGRYPQIAFYRGAALSYELGVMKPSRHYYERTIDLFTIDPAKSVFIDDLAENVAGAITCGFRGIVFTGMHELVRTLETMGVHLPSGKSP